MRHLAFVLVLGLATAVGVSQSRAAGPDPTGIWLNDDGSAKMEVKKCGKGQLCSRIVWLKDPTDSRGKPLHDARNENESLRGRPIIGLPLFSEMNPEGGNVWVGNVYNPEEGHVYSDVKVTLASSRQIVLHGCKAWLLCGEKAWTRSELPKQETAPDQIEAQAEKPAAGAKDEAVADADPASKPSGKATLSAPAPKPILHEIEADAAGGPILGGGMTKATAKAAPLPVAAEASAPPPEDLSKNMENPGAPPPFTSETPASMFATVAPPPAPEPVSQAPVAEASAGTDSSTDDQTAAPASVPLPAQKPKMRPRPQVSAQADATGSTVVAATTPRPKPKPVVKKPPEVAEDLPWLQHP